MRHALGSNWVDPPKRERKRVVNYAENEFYRQAMKSGAGPRASGIRLPKMPQLQVWPSESPQRRFSASFDHYDTTPSAQYQSVFAIVEVSEMRHG